jgi:hypothetical protein
MVPGASHQEPFCLQSEACCPETAGFFVIWAGRGAVSGRKFIFNSKLLHKMLKIMKKILNMSKIVDVR